MLARDTQSGLVDESLSALRAGATGYYEGGDLRAVTLLSNSAGALANNYTSDSFDKLTASTETLTNLLQYTASAHRARVRL